MLGFLRLGCVFFYVFLFTAFLKKILVDSVTFFGKIMIEILISRVISLKSLEG